MKMKVAFALLLTLTTAACAAPPHLFAGPDPAVPSARVPAVGYGSTVGSYASQRPVAPGGWREQNERVAPQPKSGE